MIPGKFGNCEEDERDTAYDGPGIISLKEKTSSADILTNMYTHHHLESILSIFPCFGYKHVLNITAYQNVY